MAWDDEFSGDRDEVREMIKGGVKDFLLKEFEHRVSAIEAGNFAAAMSAFPALKLLYSLSRHWRGDADDMAKAMHLAASPDHRLMSPKTAAARSAAGWKAKTKGSGKKKAGGTKSQAASLKAAVKEGIREGIKAATKKTRGGARAGYYKGPKRAYKRKKKR